MKRTISKARRRLARGAAIAPLLVALGVVAAHGESAQHTAARPGAVVTLHSAQPVATPAAATAAADPYLWLEDIDSPRALAWVRAQNEATEKKLASLPLYGELYKQALAVLDSSSRLPDVTQRGKWLYNFWKDAEHPRGIYRRTTLDELRKAQPSWQTVLDVDALARREGKPWAWKGMDCLQPQYRRCLVSLSPGGGDAVEVRELDLDRLAFVEGGFRLPLAKSRVSWRDQDTLFVGTDFGPGSMTTSGYPRIVKLWKRGTPLASARTLYEGKPGSFQVEAYRLRSDGGDVDLVVDGRTFWESEYYQLVGDQPVKLDLPASAEIVDAFGGRLLVSLKDDWKRDGHTFAQDSVVIADPAALRERQGANAKPDHDAVELLVAPSSNEVVEGVAAAKSGILVTMLDDVRGRLYRYQRSREKEEGDEEEWTRTPMPLPDNGAVSIRSVDPASGDAFVQYESFVTPPTLYHLADGGARPEEIKQMAPTFDGSRFEVTQHWTVSADGTRVPYFQVAAKGLTLDGSNPTHIFSYGGFRNALVPSYSGSYEQLSGAYGKLWLERGGVFVLANIRGGGEFGERWHQGAVKANHVHAFEDFEAVASDLIARKVTAPQHLGIEGRSNGGLLVLSTMLRRPDLYGAVVCGSPLADMQRYHKLLAGASWMAEYGDPDKPEEWAYISKYSPYQNVKAGVKYPPIFFYLSTRDDRVHPGHARKMAAKLEADGQDVTYYELVEGGHGANVTNEELAHRLALSYTHLWTRLGKTQAASGS